MLWFVVVTSVLFLIIGGIGGSVFAERQPHMHNALQAVKTAEKELNKASHDKGGHRARALEFVNKAIDEVERGMKFDNRH